MQKKQCSRCGRMLWASLVFWYSSKAAQGGLSCYCRECARAYGKKWAAENPEKVHTYASSPKRRARRLELASRPEVRERTRAKQREARSKNRDAINTAQNDRADALDPGRRLKRENKARLELLGQKHCTGCDRDLWASTAFFQTQKSNGDGLSTRCRECRQAQRKKDEAAGKYKDSHRRGAVRSKAKRDADPVVIASRKRREDARIQRQSPEAVELRKALGRERYSQRPDIIERRRLKAERKELRERDLKSRQRVERARYRGTPVGHLNHNMSKHIAASLYSGKIGRRWESRVGYTVEQLRAHLEAQFIGCMSWDNYGRAWHIDHIRPISSFSFETAEDQEFLLCWGLSNLRPLWAKSNMKKGAKWDGQVSIFA